MLRQVTLFVIVGTFLIGTYYVVAASYIPSEQQNKLAAQLNDFQPGLGYEKLLLMDEVERVRLVGLMSSETVRLLTEESKTRPSFVSESLDDLKQVANSDLQLVKFSQITALKGYNAAGTAILVQSASGNYLRLENFNVTPGIDQRVFLTKDGAISSGVDLGRLKATAGSQNYAIPSINTEEYNAVIIYSKTLDAYYAHARFLKS